MCTCNVELPNNNALSEIITKKMNIGDLILAMIPCKGNIWGLSISDILSFLLLCNRCSGYKERYNPDLRGFHIIVKKVPICNN